MEGSQTTSQVVKIYDPFYKLLQLHFENEFQNYNHEEHLVGVDAAIVDNPFSGGLNTTIKFGNLLELAQNLGRNLTPMFKI